jgi:hypothetical protein
VTVQPQASERVDIRLTRQQGAITGDVRQLDGSEIANVDQLEIQLFQNGVEISNSPVQPARNGEYTADVPVAAGGSDYTLQVDSPRFSDFSREITVQPQATETVPIRLTRQQDSSSSSIDATRTLNTTEAEVTNGSSVTVTVDAEFTDSTQNASLTETVTVTGGEGEREGAIAQENIRDITIDPADGQALPTGEPGVQVVYSPALTPIASALESKSFRLEYDLTIPAETPVGTTIEFAGTVTESDTTDTASGSVGGDTQIEVVANTPSENVTVGNQEVPVEFTTETDSGDRTVTSTDAVSAIRTFIRGSASADVAVDVIRAFIAS